MEKHLWLVFALLSALSASLVAIFGKIGLKGLDANTATAVRSVIMAAFLCLVVAVQGKISLAGEILGNRSALFYIFLSGIAGAVSWLFYFLALKYGDVSKVAPVDKLSVVLAIGLAFLFLGEKISAVGLLGAGMITVGVILVAVG